MQDNVTPNPVLNSPYFEPEFLPCNKSHFDNVLIDAQWENT